LAYLMKGSSGTQMSSIKIAAGKLEKFKYPLLVLAIGILLMLMPGKSIEAEQVEDDAARMAHILSCTEGVGEARVLISDSGVVVVCRGAGNAAVRLSITRAVSSYTGLSSDKITILKMAG